MNAVTAAEQPDVFRRAEELGSEVWPEYNRHGDGLRPYWYRLADVFPEFQFALCDDTENEPLAAGFAIPFAWDGTAEGLPAGIDGLIADGFTLNEAGGEPNSLSALAVEIPAENQGRRLSTIMLETMADIARAHGLPHLVAPVRPTWKERYPLTPIEQYARWTNDDGLPFDPWLRIHARLGADVLATDERSLRITGAVAEWEAWVGMRFPESGAYVFPHGLAPVEIDREADEGRYWEPNVWVRHGSDPARRD
jgi:hypothetical protein